MAAPQPEKKSGAMAAGGEKRCLRRREVVLRNLSERKREGKKLLMADLKRMTEKATDAGAGNKSDEDADQSENGRACGRREGDEARGCREAGDGEGGKDKVMRKAGKDKVGGEDEGDGTAEKVRKKVASRAAVVEEWRKKRAAGKREKAAKKATDAGAGNKNDEDADQSKNGRACGRRKGDEARSRREAGDGEDRKDKVMKNAGKDKVGGEDEGDGTAEKVRKKVAGRAGYGGAYIKNPGFSSGVFYFFV